MIVLAIDPNVVKPGWTPLIIIVVLAAVMVFLYRSMRHQFSKIQVPPAGGPRADGGAGDTAGDGDGDGDGDRGADVAATGPAGRSDEPAAPSD